MKITIPEPCHEDWGKMTKEDKGRFCASCSKVVVDFTEMDKEEIKDYFKDKSEEKTCGRFRNSQLVEKELLKVRPMFTEELKKFAVAIYMVFGLALFSCSDGSKEHIVGDVERVIEHVSDSIVSHNDSLDETIHETLGVVEAPIPIEETIGDVSVEEEILHTKGQVKAIDNETNKTCTDSPKEERTKMGKPKIRP